MDDVSARLDELTVTLENFIHESRQAREEEKSIRNREESKKSKEAEDSATEYQKGQTFLKQHGLKIVGLLFTGVMTFLAWYGNTILNAYKEQERNKAIDKKLEENTDSLTQFKVDTTGEITDLKNANIENRVLTVEYYNRLETIIQIAHPSLKNKEIPEKSPIIQKAENQAKFDVQMRNLNFKN